MHPPRIELARTLYIKLHGSLLADLRTLWNPVPLRKRWTTWHGIWDMNISAVCTARDRDHRRPCSAGLVSAG